LKEVKAEGGVSLEVWSYYIQMAGGALTLVSIVTAYVAVSTCLFLADYTLTLWLKSSDADHSYYLFWYGMFGLSATIFLAIRSIIFAYGCVEAGRGLHNSLLSSIMSARMLFFDENPSGRILNRFAVDLFEVEALLPHFLEHCTLCVAFVLMVLVAISIVLPWFLAVVPVLMAMCIYCWQLARPAFRECKRMHSVTRTPVFSTVGECLAGRSTIQAHITLTLTPTLTPTPAGRSTIQAYKVKPMIDYILLWKVGVRSKRTKWKRAAW